MPNNGVRSALFSWQPRRWTLAVLPLLFLGAYAPSARAWGCKGHEIVALIAEKHLTPQAQKMVERILTTAPTTDEVRRYCNEPNLSLFAASATWADDERNVRLDTGPWHFIDIPIGQPKGSVTAYCPPATSCITEAIAAQLSVLRSAPGAVSDRVRADALRFVIHFLGDIHQPLHAADNEDFGGNCVPVVFFGRKPQDSGKQLEYYRPNLHGIWDTDMPMRLIGDRTVQQTAADLEVKFKPRLAAWKSGKLDFAAWAWESQREATHVVYGKLPTPVPIATEPPLAAQAQADVDCRPYNHVAIRMLKLDEQIGDAYLAAAEPVIETRITQAGIRLAAVLNSLWP